MRLGTAVPNRLQVFGSLERSTPRVISVAASGTTIATATATTVDNIATTMSTTTNITTIPLLLLLLLLLLLRLPLGLDPDAPHL